MAASFWDWKNLIGSDLLSLFDPSAALHMPPPVATGTSPTGVVAPLPGAPAPSGPILGGTPPAASGGLLGGQGLLGHKGLLGDFGDSVLGHGLAGALAGIGKVQPGTGMLGSLGQGAQGAMDAGAARQQEQLKNWYMQQTVQQANQKTQTAQQQRDYLANAAPPPGVDPAQWKTYVQADPEGALAVLGKTMAPDKPTHSGAYNEYQDAVASGYKGGFTDYQNEDANRKRSISHTTNITNAAKPPPTMEERDRQILLQGDSSTPEYAAAYANFMRPQIHQNLDGTWTQITPPPPTWARAPTYGGPGAAGGTTAPSPAASGTTAPPPATGGTSTAPAGPTVTTGGTAKPKELTQDQAKTRQLYQHSVQQMPDVLKNYDELAKTPNVLSSKIGGTLGTATMSGPALLAYNGLLDFASSYLYVVSGATANPGEVANLAQTLMPSLNDPLEDIAAKKARMQDMLVQMRERAGLPAGPRTGGGGDTNWTYKDGKLVPEGTP